MTTLITITVDDDGTPSAFYPLDEQALNGALDYSVTIDIADRTIEGGITLYRDDANGGMSPCGSPIDGWCSPEIVTWLRTLDEHTYRLAVGSLGSGVGTETIKVHS